MLTCGLDRHCNGSNNGQGLKATDPETAHMKVLFLAAASSIHTVRWVNGLADAGVEIVLVTQHPSDGLDAANVRVLNLPFRGSAGYFLNFLALRKIIADEKPDLINAHYASGYGTTARLAGFRPILLSVWGSDVYDFPKTSPIHKWWVAQNLKAASAVASTSHTMAAQTRTLMPDLGQKIPITPFGVDTSRFFPSMRDDQDRPLVIGTVKTLDSKYGIDTLLDAVALLIQKLTPATPAIAKSIRLRIVGTGPQEAELKQRAADLGIGSIVDFVGRVPHDQVPNELHKMDIYAALSRLDSESFGVAIVEAGACGLPVVVSDVDGFSEVVQDQTTGLIVRRDDPEAAAQALWALVLDADLRQRLGDNARFHVGSKYGWQHCIDRMIDVYSAVLQQ